VRNVGNVHNTGGDSLQAVSELERHRCCDHDKLDRSVGRSSVSLMLCCYTFGIQHETGHNNDSKSDVVLRS
jgi:hypothetical protein